MDQTDKVFIGNILLREKLNLAYWERNQLIAYLSKSFHSWLELHPDNDTAWESDWRNIVFVDFPEGLFSWHIHDSEMKYFEHLKFKEGNSWDGLTTPEKYEKLSYKKQWV